MKIVENIKSWYRSLPDKKRYIEFLTALLTVPVLLTVIINNLNTIKSIRNTDQSPNTSPSGSANPVYIITGQTGVIPISSVEPTPIITPASGTPLACVKKVGPVEIVYPQQNQIVTKNPVCLDILYQQGNYCSVVWSYRINDGDWSDYSDRSICMYNLEPGIKLLNLRVRSIAASDEVILNRSFTVAGSLIPSPTATPSAF
ncbi:hypothetical protein A2154_01410 [Candidatus Gottesmanbacteria bacterium RBG_16_43_7]|uniref:Uncharacterized protein n=1 Tax=Candidatus Gottesmanbacteria bacterium RBG_16_43_7 TaxID=1798373 RepID=A0A1F5ZBS5_9BACT|nr:MAG: hypothetical protein A2154_01410 [Candidatus Gottesmanbacteria bacterium RBG_16_43_7]